MGLVSLSQSQQVAETRLELDLAPPSHPNPSGYLDKIHLNSVSHTINVNLICRGATITVLCVGRNHSLVSGEGGRNYTKEPDFTEV